MSTFDPGSAAAFRSLHCRHCGELIGVYEPLIRLTDGRAVESSRAVDPELSDQHAEHYHRACFERLGETPPPVP